MGSASPNKPVLLIPEIFRPPLHRRVPVPGRGRQPILLVPHGQGTHGQKGEQTPLGPLHAHQVLQPQRDQPRVGGDVSGSGSLVKAVS